jgi:hypothetical protein
MAKSGNLNILIPWGDDIGWWNISYNSSRTSPAAVTIEVLDPVR